MPKEITHRICYMCEVNRDIDLIVKVKLSFDGFQFYCKECLMDGKYCSKCDKWKCYNHFYEDIRALTGYKSQCKKCVIDTNSRSRSRYYKINILKTKTYYEKNKEKIKQKSRDYYAKNKEKVKRRCVEYKRKRILSDPLYRLQDNLRSRVRHAFEEMIENKKVRSIELLGCDTSYWKKWLEFSFDKKVRWKYFGRKYHIDHIIPISDFNLKNKGEQFRAFNWSNTRITSIKDNLVKSNKRDYEVEIEYKQKVIMFQNFNDFKLF